MKNEGKSDYTIRFTSKALSLLSKHADLNNPEQVKQYIAQLNTSTSYKRNLCIAYNKYCKFYKIEWEMPLYKPQAKQIKIPTKEKLEMIIARARKPLSTKLKISMECGLRPIEAMNLRFKDVDLENGVVYPETANHGSARALKLKSTTLNMLNRYIASGNIELNDKLFGSWNSNTYGKWFRIVRNRVAKKIGDPSIKGIRLYDLRHFYATMIYHKTKGILYVKQQMGHKKIETTLIYTQLVDVGKDEFTSAIAKNLKEACKLIEAGFEYVIEMDGAKIFRKRK